MLGRDLVEFGFVSIQQEGIRKRPAGVALGDSVGRSVFLFSNRNVGVVFHD